METEDITEPLTQAVKNCKRQALAEFIRQLMPILKQSGWDLEHLIDALVCYAYQRDDWEVVVKHLEDASNELGRLRRF